LEYHKKGFAMETKNHSAEFYVNAPGYEVVWAEDSRFQVCRNGEMRIRDNVREAVYRYTSDLVEAGITNDAELQALYESADYLVVDNPWFEVFDTEDSGDEGEVFHHLVEAIARAEELSAGNE
jgi:hypothetical protein